MGTADPDVEAELRRAAAFRAALRRFTARTEEVAASADLTPQRYDLLLAIRTAPHGTSTVTELSRQLGLRQTAVTELVNRAEEAGLVARRPSPNDGRVTLLRLSAKGERRLMRAFEDLRHDRERLREALREVGALLRELSAGTPNPK